MAALQTAPRLRHDGARRIGRLPDFPQPDDDEREHRHAPADGQGQAVSWIRQPQLGVRRGEGQREEPAAAAQDDEPARHVRLGHFRRRAHGRWERRGAVRHHTPGAEHPERAARRSARQAPPEERLFPHGGRTQSATSAPGVICCRESEQNDA